MPSLDALKGLLELFIILIQLRWPLLAVIDDGEVSS